MTEFEESVPMTGLARHQSMEYERRISQLRHELDQTSRMLERIAQQRNGLQDQLQQANERYEELYSDFIINKERRQ